MASSNVAQALVNTLKRVVSSPTKQLAPKFNPEGQSFGFDGRIATAVGTGDGRYAIGEEWV
jgi:hypothetical protein